MKYKEASTPGQTILVYLLQTSHRGRCRKRAAHEISAAKNQGAAHEVSAAKDSLEFAIGLTTYHRVVKTTFSYFISSLCLEGPFRGRKSAGVNPYKRKEASPCEELYDRSGS